MVKGGVMRYRFLALLLLLGACSSSGSDESETPVVSLTTTTIQVTTTTEATTTTLSEHEIAQAAIDEAKAEIEAVTIDWYTFPVDTSKGEDGMQFQAITGRLEQRMRDLQTSREAAGEIQRSRGADQIEVSDIRVDLEAGKATVDICTLGDHVLVDAETGEQLNADDGDSWEGEAFVVLLDGVWLVEDFYSAQKTGGNECLIAS